MTKKTCKKIFVLLMILAMVMGLLPFMTPPVSAATTHLVTLTNHATAGTRSHITAEDIFGAEMAGSVDTILIGFSRPVLSTNNVIKGDISYSETAPFIGDDGTFYDQFNGLMLNYQQDYYFYGSTEGVYTFTVFLSNEDFGGEDNYEVTITVDPVPTSDHAPTLTATGSTPTFTENGSAVDLFSDVTAATNDSSQSFGGMTLTVSNVTDTKEYLSIGGTDVELTNGKNGSLSDGSYSVVVASNTATVTVNGMSSSDEDMGTLIDGITYRNTSDEPSASNSRTITITGITDSGSSSNSASPNTTATVSIAAINDAPTLSATPINPAFTEGSTAAVQLFSSASVSTVESGQKISELKLTVSNVTDGSSEILTVDGTNVALTDGTAGTTAANSVGYSVSLSGNTANVALSKTGDLTISAAQNLINGLAYKNTSYTLTAANRNITLISITDNGGTANTGLDSQSLNIVSTVAVADDTTAPTVTGVSSPTADGTYKEGDVITVIVSFSEAVTVTGTPQLTLETGMTDRTVDYASGSGTSTLTFIYTVQPGDLAADLDYIGANALSLNGGTIKDAAENDATLTLAAPGASNSLGASKALVIDGTAPTITGVSSPTADGTYKAGDVITVIVSFSEAVTVTGTPQLNLETGMTDRTVNYVSGSGTGTITFNYTVQPGELAADLDYTEANALVLNGGTIKDAAGNNAALTLAAPGTANSLGWNKALVIDGIAPTVTGVSSMTADGTYKAGDVITVIVSFSEAVTVTGTPQLTLETGTNDRTVNYASGSGTAALVFSYTVQSGDSSSDLDYKAANALVLNGGTIKDTAGNDAVLTLAVPGAANSLGWNKALVINGVVPTVTISSGVANPMRDNPFFVTITFSASVLDFELSDIMVTNGVASNLSGSGTTYTADITPSGQGTVTVNVSAGAAHDAAGNANTPAAQLSRIYDSMAPTISSSALTSNNSYIDISFSEGVYGSDDGSTALTASNLALTFTKNSGTVTEATISSIKKADNAVEGSASALTGGETTVRVFLTLTGTSNGLETIEVKPANGTSVYDQVGNAMANNQTTGVKTLNDQNPPTVVGAVRTDNSHIIVTLSKSCVNIAKANDGGFTVAETGAPGTHYTVTAISQGGNASQVILTVVDIGASAKEGLTVKYTAGGNGTVQDTFGNAMATDGTGEEIAAWDTTAPTISSIERYTPPAAATNATSVVFRVVFDEAVTGVDAGDFVLTATGSASGSVGSVSSSDSTMFDVVVNSVSGAGTLRIDLKNSGTGIADIGGNAITTGFTGGQTFAIDRVSPTVSSVSVPTNGTYKTDDLLNFTVNFNEAVTVTGTPILSITLDTGGTVSAAYGSGSGSTELVFAYTIASGNTDSTGITVGILSGTIEDAVGNDAALTLNLVGSTAGVLVDTTAPTASSGGAISVSDLTSNSAKLAWTVATDSGSDTANLQYKVVYSTSAISSVAVADALSGTWTSNIATATVTGLAASTDYQFCVLVRDEAGNKTLYAAAAGKTAAAASGGGGSGGTNTGSTSTSTVVEVNGEKQDAGTTNTQTAGGQTVTTIKVDDAKLDKVLDSKGEKPTITLPTGSNSDVTVGELNGQTVKNMEQKEAILEIKTPTVTYTLPASQIKIDDVVAQIGSKVELKDIKVSVKIAEPSADTVKIVENTADKNNYQIVVKPIEFEITCTSGDKTVDVSRFNGYVERTVAIPDGIDPNKITTGIVLNSDGTFSHVPTQIVIIGGTYYAKINSLTNSTYSVIWNPVTFKDVENHWSKDTVNDMGSRMVVTGTGNGTYEPDRSITRAEFAAIAVRAMGLQKGTTESNFGDVTLTDWFNGYVDTATKYSLITGYDSTSYGPSDMITREQAMTILARAMKLTGLNTSLTDSEQSTILSKYTDGALVSDYAKTSTAICIKTGVVTGSSATTLSPKEYVTRAEVAAMVQRLLQKSGLI